MNILRIIVIVAPRNPALRNHFLLWILSNHQAATFIDGHLPNRVFSEDQQISQSADPP